jgi:cyclophilin family peptidyl-prolyl cis-trans isomerase
MRISKVLNCSGFAILAFNLLSNNVISQTKEGEIRLTEIMPAVSTPLPTHDFNNPERTELLTVDLRNHFTLPGVNPAQLVQIKTTYGTFNAELLVADAPLSVANFKSYLATDATPAANRATTYDNTFFHRAGEKNDASGRRSEFVVQGGGYRLVSSLPALTKKPAVMNEFKVANTRGTIAMAKADKQPNSATSEWFVNMVDNKTDLSTANNSGFTVFARVLGSGMKVFDAVAKLPTYSLGGPYSELPLRGVQVGQQNVFFSNFIALETARIVPLHPPVTGKGNSVLTYTFTNDNPSAASSSIANGKLTVKRGKFGGRALITLRAAESSGAFIESTLTVTHSGPPRVVKQLPAATSAALGSILSLNADITAWPLAIKWQRRIPPSTDWVDLVENSSSAPTRFSGVASETLTVRLTGTTPLELADALALSRSQFRFVVANNLPFTTAPFVEGNPTTLTVTTALAFAAKLAPTSTAALGSTLTLRVAATAATYPAPSYQWQRRAPGANSVWENLTEARVPVSATETTPAILAIASPYSNSKTADLTISLKGTTPATGSDINAQETIALTGTQYRCRISHNRGAGEISADSTATTLKITTLTLAIAEQPVSTSASFNETTPLRITVKADSVVANTPVSYQWQSLAPTRGSAWTNVVNSVAAGSPPVIIPYAGATTATLSISPGSNFDTAIALDGYKFRCRITTLLQSVPAPLGGVKGEVTSKEATFRFVSSRATLTTPENITLPSLSNPGATFSATGLPAGLRIDATSGLITGVTNAKRGLYKVTVTARVGTNSVIRVYYLEVVGLSGFNAGSFEALLSPATPNTPPVAKITLTLTENALFTGTLITTTEVKPLAFKGAVTRSASGALTLIAPVSIARPGAPTGRAYVVTDLTVSPAGVLSLKLKTRATAKAVELTEIAATTNGIHLNEFSATRPAPWANRTYSLALTDPAALPGASTALFPAGSSYAVGTLDSSAKLTFTGKTADGVSFTASLPAGPDGSYLLFNRPYEAAAGSYLAGRLRLSATPPSTRYSLALSDRSEVYWAKPALVNSTNYRSGFGPLDLTARLEPIAFSSGNALGLKDSSISNGGEIDLLLSGQSVNNESPNPRGLPLRLFVNYNNTEIRSAGLLANPVVPDPSNFSAVLSLSNGVFNGSFKVFDGELTRTVQVEGIVLVPETTPYAGEITFEGFTLIPPLDPADTSTSGRIQFKSFLTAP